MTRSAIKKCPTYGVEKACREKVALKVQLSLRSTSSVELPRYKERDARFGAGLESSFSSFGETSLLVLTHRCQMLNGGEAAEGA